MRYSEAVALRHKIEHAAAQQNDADALQSIELFPKWAAGIDATAGERRQYNAKLYRCVQSHHTQVEWAPDLTPALWTEVSVEEWPEWIRPTSAETAYNIGDKVTFEGKRYISAIDGNVWSPTEYPQGWSLAN